MKELESVQEFTASTAKGKVLLDFWAPWCAPCKVLIPVLEDVSQGHKEMSFYKVNADTDHGQELAVQFGVGSLPTMILFQDGKKLRSLAGNTAKVKIEEFLSR